MRENLATRDVFSLEVSGEKVSVNIFFIFINRGDLTSGERDLEIEAVSANFKICTENNSTTPLLQMFAINSTTLSMLF